MELLTSIAQIIIAAGIVNVWILRFNKKTTYRGGSAKNMKEEFAAYGLPPSVMMLVGALKLGLAALLIIGFWVPNLVQPAAMGMALLMVGALFMHVKVGDPMVKSLPALAMLLLSALVAFG